MERIDLPLTIFSIGATGDLAKKKILPAFFELYQKQILPRKFKVIGVARTAMSTAEFVTFAQSVIKPKELGGDWQAFCQNLHFVSGDVSVPATFKSVKKLHDQFTECGNHLWYVATLPHLYTDVIRNIKAVGMQQVRCGWTKLLLEKPFGTDLASSQVLNAELLQVFEEDQIYRIDHFLAKETIQNLMVFRFGNGIFEHLWNSQHVDNIQITASESIGINGRSVFYDSIGVTRDVVQNHIMQMLTMCLMEEPAELSASTIHQHRMKFLSQVEIIPKNAVASQVAFGQYTAGTMNGEAVCGYQEESEQLHHSTTATAIAAKLHINSERWKGTPVYLRAGKRLSQTITEITFQFKEPLNAMFKNLGITQQSNTLTLRIQPNEGVVLRINVKQPGLRLDMSSVPMQFCYKTEFQMGLVEAYEKLIYDAVQGDPTLFPQAQDIDASWRIVQPLLELAADASVAPDQYAAGTWGPQSFHKILELDGRRWIEPSPHICNL